MPSSKFLNEVARLKQKFHGTSRNILPWRNCDKTLRPSGQPFCWPPLAVKASPRWLPVIISHDRFFLDRIATHMLAFEGDSHVKWFEGNFADYEEDKNRRLGIDSVIPHRLKYKKFSR
jgi:hypothetical protein